VTPGPKLSAKAKWQKAYYDRLAAMPVDERPRFDEIRNGDDCGGSAFVDSGIS
jgi:hypothetical protein